MSDEQNKDVKDIAWQSIDSEKGEINFRNNKKGKRIRVFFKAIIFILIAAITGGISGAYVVEKKFSDKIYTYPENGYSFKNEDGNSDNIDLPKNAVTEVAEMVGPAVVGISNRVEGFMGEIDQNSGSGIIFDQEGYIVTNYHVIAGASSVSVKLSNGKIFPANIIGYDKTSDLAVIKIDVKNLPTAKFGDSSKVRVGDVAIAIGNPLGEEFSGSVTAGIISALNRRIRVGETIYKVLQTDAAINPGNSGGALCNEAGEVIGINSLKIGSDSNVEGMGFAISINEAKDIIKSLMDYGKVSRPFIGIAGFDAIPERNNGVAGAYVQQVVPSTGADEAGIRPSDIIIEMDGQKVESFDDLSKILENHKVGDVVECKVWSDGKTKTVSLKLTEKTEQ